MKNTLQDIEQLQSRFQSCQKIFTALGDENRQRLLCIMLGGQCGGSRVVDIAWKTNLSRPAVSHHMQILKNAGIKVSAKVHEPHIWYWSFSIGHFNDDGKIFIGGTGAKMIKIHVLKCGSTIVDEALPLSDKSKNPLAYTGIGRNRNHKIEVPVTAYLVEHPRGLVLVDTGWDTRLRENARKYEGFANYFASPGFLPEGQAVTEHLARLGYVPGNIDYCILTHLDIDHAGGLRLVKGAKQIMASEAEMAAAAKPHVRYLKRLWGDVTIQTFPNEEYDLFQDGSIMLLPLPGHSAGMTGVKIQNGRKYVMIAGDAGYCRQSWERLTLPGITWDKKKALQSLQLLQAAAKDTDCVAILATHDREVSSDTIVL